MTPTLVTKRRLLAFLAAVFFLLVLLLGRLGWLQLYHKAYGYDLREEASSQWTLELVEYPMRGTITDRNGNVLAMSASCESLAARPRSVTDAADYAARLASALGLDEQELRQKLSDTSKSFVWVKRQLTAEEAETVRRMNLAGLDFTDEPKRYYPGGTLAAQVLGFTQKYADADGLVGQEGIELYYDEYLKGYPGINRTEVDSQGHSLADGVDTYVSAIDGLQMSLTIDKSIQYFVERAVEDAAEKYQTKKIYCIVMDPDTGEILAMAGSPTYNANDPPRDLGYDEMQDYVKNITCKDILEPGSTFKIVTLSAALDSGSVSEHASFYCPGYRVIDGQRIRCSKAGGHGSETLIQGVQNSCNPVFMDLACAMGAETFYKYIRSFGFGAPTGIDIYGEESGVLIPESKVKIVDIARIGFGQAIAVTPLQLVTAAAAAINGGNLMVPHLMKDIYRLEEDPETGETVKTVVRSNEPTVVRRVISEDTSATVREMLEAVVDGGSGKNAYIEGYRIGGKTGTAQKYDENGVIMPDKHISSFIGFAPADDPQFLVYFALDEPIAESDYGSIVAAPYVKEILQQMLQYRNIEPSTTTSGSETADEVITVPDCVGGYRGDGPGQADGSRIVRVFAGSRGRRGDGADAQSRLPRAGRFHDPALCG